MRAAIIGAGPAGLMAAEVLAQAGVSVDIYEQKPSAGRKFLMAGKSGLNLTQDAPVEPLLAAYDTTLLAPMVRAFDAQAIRDWAQGLGQPVFTGSAGKVFPEAMKASPLLRAWLGRLQASGVRLHTRWRWTGWSALPGDLIFDMPEGTREVHADCTLLAMGGGSWSRLGSDGLWQSHLQQAGVETAPFAPSNAGLRVDWSAHMAPHFGSPIKAVTWRAADTRDRGEGVLSARGLEGAGVYALSRAVRAGAPVSLDLLPDLRAEQVADRLAAKRPKESLSNHLRKSLRLPPVKRALLREWAHPMPSDPMALATLLKALPVRHAGFLPLDEAISTAGGLAFTALDAHLMLRKCPGVFAAGEMIDWDAPTGGYLLTACLATGRWAGQGALTWLGDQAVTAL